MWKLNNIYANNICAFEELSYDLPQHCTTLVFGNNMDNDSQGSNGSGKSALLETIAIGIAGEPLRKIKIEEIINDFADEAFIRLMFYNEIENIFLFISRYLYRKSSQGIFIELGHSDGSREQVVQSSVADYNKYILETIGLTKDDIYSNFILSKHRYTSFLSSSDREKKEIINRFSNGVMVDESIAALQEDMEPIQKRLQTSESNVATCSGRVSAIEDQIANEMAESTERSQKKADRIAGWKQAIVDKRALIREKGVEINGCNELLGKYDAVDEQLQALESGDGSVFASFNAIRKLLAKLALALSGDTDYVERFEQDQAALINIEKQAVALEEKSIQQEKELQLAKKAHAKLSSEYDQFQKDYGVKAGEIDNLLASFTQAVEQLESANKDLKRQRVQTETWIADIQKQLAGVIQCPKCRHEFTLVNNIDIEASRLQLQDYEREVEAISLAINKNQESVSSNDERIRSTRAERGVLDASKADRSVKITESQTHLNKMVRDASVLSSDTQALQDKINAIQKSLDTCRLDLFDDAYGVLDGAIKTKESAIQQANDDISNAEGAILSYEESLKEVEAISDTELLDSLKSSKQKYEKELAQAIVQQEDVHKELNELKTQEATFIEFKTHLANTKIDALSHITNEFLEAIGSDIRISFSGYTVLKSGKIRDKISISLIRDGVDCGSFGKFSEGEKARVNLANILAMHKLTNVNCLEGKGLDLLILDEILDATDETGLANIFEALNSLQITSLAVSHGHVAENYPHQLVVNKKNGISFII